MRRIVRDHRWKHLNDPSLNVSRGARYRNQAKVSFENLIARSKVFDIQGIDIHDNGTDYRIEVNENESATNARVDVQLKGTEAEANSDNTVSISVSRFKPELPSVHPYSFYVCYHLPTSRLLYRMGRKCFQGIRAHRKTLDGPGDPYRKFSEPLGEKELENLLD